jgi:hypothetical protein
MLRLPDGQRIIIYSWYGQFRVWDLEKGMQVGKEWGDKEFDVMAMASSPDGKTVATGNMNGAVKLWNIDTGKVIKEWTRHIERLESVCWSPDGGRVVSGILGLEDDHGTFRVRDVENGKTILGPIHCKAGGLNGVAVCYSPDGKMIATGGFWLKIWDANTGELLKTMVNVIGVMCLTWTSDGKTLIAGGSHIRKCDTATWTVVLDVLADSTTISLSPNERILASTSFSGKTVQLWNLETNQSIGTLLHPEDGARSMTFSTDGMFFVTGCIDGHLYTWDLSAILKGAGLLSDIADATPRPAPKMKGTPQIPPGFFNDALREANLRTRLSQSHGPHTNHPTSAPRQYILSSFWRRSKSHRATECDTQSQSRYFSWNLVGMLRRQDRPGIQLREVEVPCTAEELSREKETSRRLISIFQYSYHAATQHDNTDTIIVAATTNC